MLSNTVQPIEVEEASLIGEWQGGTSLSLAKFLRQLQDSTGISLPQANDDSTPPPA